MPLALLPPSLCLQRIKQEEERDEEDRKSQGTVPLEYVFFLSQVLYQTTPLQSSCYTKSTYLPRNKEKLHGCVCPWKKKSNASLALQSFALIPSLAFIFIIIFVFLQCLRFLFNLSITPQYPLSQLSTLLLLYMQPMSQKHVRRPNTRHLGTS